ncbi:hypothetical protein HB364_12580 [Pseudoflavitalea sp. X16]|uniref:hypothetical protein n=1 Tax=Paraflavitalea devenefica TaxID=2716334 RepID=UPI001424276F|nr:hypothetical protein [Paraflavitalea devenefica]NII25923.1 hypothetical protein [Paraflavitalea devenefica]
MKKITLLVVAFLCATYSFAIDTKPETGKQEFTVVKTSEVKPDVLKKQMTLTFTDECGTEWTITASCGSCTDQALLNGINNWLNEHSTGGGCYQD